MPTAGWRSLLPKIALALATFACSGLALECGFRALGIRADYPTPRSSRVTVAPGGPTERAPHAFIPLSILETTYGSDPRNYFGPGNRIDHVHNSAGWRDVEHSLQKPPGVFRILGLGDSYLFGQGVRREDIVLTRVGAKLAEAFPELDVETINTGTSGTNTAMQRALLEDRGLAYHPDLVILHFVLNDVEENTTGPEPKIEFFRNYLSIYQRPDRLSEISVFWGWARQRYLKTYRARSYIAASLEGFRQDHAKWAKCRQALDEIHRITRERGIGLLVVIFPFFHELDGDYAFQPIHDIVRGHLESEGIPVVDLRDAYRGFSGPELWVHPTDQHPNEIGHRIAADAIVGWLIEHPSVLGR